MTPPRDGIGSSRFHTAYLRSESPSDSSTCNGSTSGAAPARPPAALRLPARTPPPCLQPVLARLPRVVEPAPRLALARPAVAPFARLARLRVRAAPEDEVAPLAARDCVRAVPVVAAVQHCHARPVAVHKRLLGRRAGLLVRGAADAAEEELPALKLRHRVRVVRGKDRGRGRHLPPEADVEG